MSIRRGTRTRGGRAALAVTACLLLAVTGCSGDSGDEAGKTPAPGAADSSGGQDGNGSGGGRQETLAEVKGGEGGNLTLTITSAERDGSGFTTFKGTLKNNGPSVAVLPGWSSQESELKDNGLSMAGATMVDRKGKKRYFILRDTNGRCLCTRFTGGFQQGQETEWFAQFPAPPASAEKVDFQVADLPSATVELSGE